MIMSSGFINCLILNVPERITDFDYKLLRLPHLDYWLTADVTGQQGILIPPRHLTSPLVQPGFCAFFAPFFVLLFFGLRD